MLLHLEWVSAAVSRSTYSGKIDMFELHQQSLFNSTPLIGRLRFRGTRERKTIIIITCDVFVYLKGRAGVGQG